MLWHIFKRLVELAPALGPPSSSSGFGGAVGAGSEIVRTSSSDAASPIIQMLDVRHPELELGVPRVKAEYNHAGPIPPHIDAASYP